MYVYICVCVYVYIYVCVFVCFLTTRRHLSKGAYTITKLNASILDELPPPSDSEPAEGEVVTEE